MTDKKTDINYEKCLEIAQCALQTEAEALSLAAKRLDKKFIKVIKFILTSGTKVIVTGIGKSGHIGNKIVSTLCSTGTPAVYLHASEAVHGDLGVYLPGDPTIMISKSGTTAELVRLIPILRQFQSPLIGILGNLNSPLSRQVDVVLDARVSYEADELNLAPTTSSTVALGLGDALAVALMHARGFDGADFARYHPAGQLGKNLWLRVSDGMHANGEVALVAADDSLRQVVIAMTQQPLGAACVIDKDQTLLGIITDGDVRRALQEHEDIRPLRAEDIMTRAPITVSPDDSLKKAAHLMEDRPSQISVLPVVDNEQRCRGVIRIHDIYQVNLQ